MGLNALNDRQFTESLKKSVHVERESTIDVLDHLNELERRRLQLELGFSSTFAYCVQELHYSESAANRRIKSARTMRRYPELREMLRDRKISLSTIARIARHLTPQNRTSLLGQVIRKTRREVDELLAIIDPSTMRRERIIPISVELTAPAPEDLLGGGNFLATGQTSTAAEHVDGANRPDSDRRHEGSLTAAGPDTPDVAKASTCPSQSKPSTVTVRRYEFKFSVDEATMMATERARKLAATGQSMEKLYAKMLVEFLDRHDPERRAARRKARRATREQTHGGKTHCPETSRHIPIEIRDEVWQRDGARCTYTGPDGRRCNATDYLEIDHIHPFACGGTHTLENLRLLCGGHNRHEAEKRFGRRR